MRWPFVSRQVFDELDDHYGALVRYAAKLEATVSEQYKLNAALRRQVAHYRATADTGLIVGQLDWRELVQ